METAVVARELAGSVELGQKGSDRRRDPAETGRGAPPSAAASAKPAKRSAVVRSPFTAIQSTASHNFGPRHSVFVAGTISAITSRD